MELANGSCDQARRGLSPPRLAPCWAHDHPRLRGDHRDIPRHHAEHEGSPPLTRGPLIAPSAGHRVHGITPAYAGTTLDCRIEGIQARDHPRLRGDHYSIVARTSGYHGSPPLTRGPLLPQKRQTLHRGITPAYAGTTSPGRSIRLLFPDHPRLRGDHARARAS